MNKLLCLIIVFLATTCYSQSISISSFKLLDTDLTANTAGTLEQDQNGETSALIKVVTTQTGFTFDGGALGIVKTAQKPSEIWVYVPRGLKKLTISHPQLGMLRDFYFPIAIEAARTYEMVLVTGEIQTVVKQARSSQYVVFKLTPPNAVVELNGEQLETADGIATKFMKFGTYNYRVNAPNYLPEAGNVTVEDPESKHIVNISLKPNFSQVTLKVDNGAEIWVNGEQKGVCSWTGNLGAGTYDFEAKKEGHRSSSVTHDIVVTSAPQTIELQSPIPIYGEVNINSSPAMADISIDGKKVGQTPMIISNLLIGEHQIKITKQDYNDYTTSILVSENTNDPIIAVLDKNKMVPVNFDCDVNDGIIYIDGEIYGNVSGLTTLESGVHKIRIVAKGYKDYIATINTEEIISSNYRIRMEPKRILKNDLRNIIITNNAELVKDMEKVGYFYKFEYKQHSASSKKKCINKMKTDAAGMGANIILINEPESATFSGFVNGTAYKYNN